MERRERKEKRKQMHTQFLSFAFRLNAFNFQIEPLEIGRKFIKNQIHWQYVCECVQCTCIQCSFFLLLFFRSVCVRVFFIDATFIRKQLFKCVCFCDKLNPRVSSRIISRFTMLAFYHMGKPHARKSVKRIAIKQQPSMGWNVN